MPVDYAWFSAQKVGYMMCVVCVVCVVCMCMCVCGCGVCVLCRCTYVYAVYVCVAEGVYIGARGLNMRCGWVVHVGTRYMHMCTEDVHGKWLQSRSREGGHM